MASTLNSKELLGSPDVEQYIWTNGVCREEDDAVALVRVYCGLASADRAEAQPGQEVWLTVAVVDDAGRLLDICEVSDDAQGYAEFSALLAHRAGGSTTVGVATDSDEHAIIQLLTAAGRLLAYTDEDSADDYTERFADNGSQDELQANPSQRRAIGLARALQAGVLSAVPQSPPRDMIALKPLLAAHSAVVSGRQAAAGTLREVLRELYPAALRAYPDPAEPIPLAVLDALPEPGLLGGGGQAAKHRDEQIVADLTSHGVADSATLSEAIAALRGAVVETPRRAGVTRSLTSAVAETIRQSVASVRASDAASRALISVLHDRIQRRSASARSLANAVSSATAANSTNGTGKGTNGSLPNRRPVPASKTLPSAVSAPPVISAPPVSAPPAAPAQSGIAALLARRAAGSPSPQPPAAPPTTLPAAAPPAVSSPMPATSLATSEPTRTATPPQLPTRTPASTSSLTIPPPAYSDVAKAGGFESKDRFDGPPPRATGRRAESSGGGHRSDPGSFPGMASSNADEDYPRRRHGVPAQPAAGFDNPLDRGADNQQAANAPKQREGRVTPPWQADDLPEEPPSLRLVETVPPAHSAGYRDPLGDGRIEPPALRLVDSDRPLAHSSRREEPLGTRTDSRATAALDRADLPVAAEEDGDLLIFAQAKSAWFLEEPADSAELSWSTTAFDDGWRVAEHAASPMVGGDTRVGLPRRVPQENLVPGSVSHTPAERPLRIVRDAAAIAAHTTGYFQGWRRGQEVGGFAVGGRPGRESANGWDFTRSEYSESHDYEYRSARR